MLKPFCYQGDTPSLIIQFLAHLKQLPRSWNAGNQGMKPKKSKSYLVFSSSYFFRQNKVFSTDAKKFYREIGKGKISVEEPPSQEDIEGFWNNIWGKKKSYNREATWIEREEERMQGKKEQEWEEITVEEVRVALGKTQKWKSPGIDKVQNFWLNYLPSMHRVLTFFLNELVGNPNSIPEWLTEGVTYLLPKSEDTKNPNNYRPITCLNTIYKLLTSVLTERMYSFLEDNSILPTEQKGCKHLQRMDRKTRKLLTCNRMLHPKSDVDRLYLPRSKGGRGLLQIEQAYKIATIGMSKYLECSSDWMMALVHRHEQNKTSHSIVKEANKYARESDINTEPDVVLDQPATKIAIS
ncbi:uncharacterized protein [Clytia hemisphaerica]|uniref:uncharacterized protein n=1 Tax=Clytia hemisphaerica TaxID=252671 RepID=UPI0034D7AD2B